MSGVCMSKNKRCVQWVKYRPRKSRDRRLLEALLRCFTVECKLLLLIDGHLSNLTVKQEQQLIAIKEAMARKGGRK